MFVFAGKASLRSAEIKASEAVLLKTPESRTALALIDFFEKLTERDEVLSVCEADRAARLEVIQQQEKEFTKRLGECEADRAVRLEKLQECEADRAARLEVIHEQSRRISETEAELEVLKSSISWKISTPLRWLEEKLKYGNNK